MPNATILGYNFIDSAINDFDNYPLNISNYKGHSTTGGCEPHGRGKWENERM